MSALAISPSFFGKTVVVDQRIKRSLRLRGSAIAALTRTFPVAGNRKTNTMSLFFKRGTLGAGTQILFGVRNGDTSIAAYMGFTGDAFDISFIGGARLTTTALFRDPSAFYHLTVAIDTTQAVAADRIKIYMGPNRITAFSTNTPPAQNADLDFNAATTHAFGQYGSVASSPFDGVIARPYFIGGLALDPTSFAGYDSNKVWTPKLYVGSFGTNGSCLTLEDNSATTSSTLGKDSSSNGNDYTPVNISLSGSLGDSLIDVPNNYDDLATGRGNYAVLSAINAFAGTLSQGNQQFYYASTTAWASAAATLGMKRGKWWWEQAVANLAANSVLMMGISPEGTLDYSNTSAHIAASGQSGLALYTADGSVYSAGSVVASGAGALANGDVVGIAVDMDAKTITFYKNGVVIYSNISIASVITAASTAAADGVVYPAVSSASGVSYINFGQRPFVNTPPSGFKALNTQNMAAALIPDPSKYHNVVIYNATAGAQSITGMGFMADMLHFKARNVGRNNCEFNSVRGPTKALHSNLNNAEATDTDALASFDADGFSLLPYVSGGSAVNTVGDIMVAAGWKKGIIPGFDIVTYTGTGANRTVPHGLNAVPAMLIHKQLSAAKNWSVWHKTFSAIQYLLWNAVNAVQTDATRWNSQLPTTSVFSLGTSTELNALGETYITYLWSEVEGFSKFGSFPGNALTNGRFVYCGFKPKFLMIKVTDQAYPWIIYDSARNTFNPVYNKLSPGNASVENDTNTLGDASQNLVDFVSNGFKIRTANGNSNNSGSAIVFMAFAENPFNTAGAR